MGDDQNLWPLFEAEAGDLLVELEPALESLSALPDLEVADAATRCLRLAHSLKGAAAVVGVGAVESLAHSLEDALQPVRTSGARPGEALMTILLAIQAVMQRIVAGENLDREAEALVAELETACLAQAGCQPSAIGVDTPAPAEIREAADPADSGRPSATGAERPAPSKDEEVRSDASTVRVETARLDRLMDYAGELLETRSRLLAHSRQLAQFNSLFQEASMGLLNSEAATWHTLRGMLAEIVHRDRTDIRRFGQLGDEINVAMKEVRMLPFRSVTTLWRRMVETTAAKLGKEVALSLDLGDIEVDRYLLDRLRDPLMHVLRNAVDHGLEGPDERAAAGKASTGQILVQAAKAGNTVRIEISDDGRGLDPRRIGAAAVAAGLVRPEQLPAMSDADLLALLFSPGFSTAEAVSTVSGRGVGLDVVRRRVEELGGRIEIGAAPTLGGTTFHVTVPISLLSTKGLLVRADEATYVIAVDAVQATLRVDASDLHDLSGPVLPREGRSPLPVRWMSSLMGGRSTPQRERLSIVVFGHGEQELGVVVDDVLAEQEVVTKRLPWNLAGVSGVNGAVILADGGLALDVDVGHLFGAASNDRASRAQQQERQATGRPHILVVDDSLTVRSTLRRTLVDADYRVAVAEDGEQAWRMLQDDLFDLVIADVQMPNLDGFSLTRRIRKSPSHDSLPVLLVTNLGSADDIAQGAAAGADEYLVKGAFAQESLLQAVARLL